MSTVIYVSIDELYKIFTESPIIDIRECRKRKSREPTIPLHLEQKESKDVMTPTTKKLYEAFTPETQKRILEDFKKDDKIIDKEYEKEIKNDPDYIEKTENGELGFYMELFVAYFGTCPVCKANSLRCYSKSNIPVVDVICINKNTDLHNFYPRYFQIKIAVNDSTYFTNDYITVGSKNYGFNCHEVDIKNKNYDKIVIGYICIKLSYCEESNIYSVIRNKSFVLVPTFNHSIGKYYRYLTESYFCGKNAITWNKRAVKKLDISNCLKYNIINTIVPFSKKHFDNPFKEDSLCRTLFSGGSGRWLYVHNKRDYLHLLKVYL